MKICISFDESNVKNEDDLKTKYIGDNIIHDIEVYNCPKCSQKLVLYLGHLHTITEHEKNKSFNVKTVEL